jgi:hypothetical protein
MTSIVVSSHRTGKVHRAKATIRIESNVIGRPSHILRLSVHESGGSAIQFQLLLSIPVNRDIRFILPPRPDDYAISMSEGEDKD